MVLHHSVLPAILITSLALVPAVAAASTSDRKQCEREVAAQYASPHSTSLSGFDQSADELNKLKDDYVVRNLCWYRAKAAGAMWRFRLIAVLTVLFAAAVPFLANVQGRRVKVYVLPAVSLAVAALTGIGAIFGWQQQWQGFRQAEFALEAELATWKLALINSRAEADSAAARRAASDATERLLEHARAIVAKETGAYFSSVSEKRASPVP